MAIAPEHAELNEHLNAYLDGELDAAAHDAFERHLRACPACQLDIEQLRATRTAVQSLSTLRAPRPMTITAPAATGRLHTQGGRLGRWLPWTWRLGAFAAAGCVLVGAVSAILPAAPRQTSASTAKAVAPAAEQAAPGAGVSASQGRAPQLQAPAPQTPEQQSASLPAPTQAPTQTPAQAPPGQSAQRGSGGAASASGAPAAPATPQAQVPSASSGVVAANSDAGAPSNAAATATAAQQAQQAAATPAAAARQPDQAAANPAATGARPVSPALSAGNQAAAGTSDNVTLPAGAPPEMTARGVATQPAGPPAARNVAPYWLGSGALLALASGVAFLLDRRWLGRL